MLTDPNVLFQGSGDPNDILDLKVVGGVLEYQVNGDGYSSDLDSAPGVQSLSVAANSVITIDQVNLVRVNDVDRAPAQFLDHAGVLQIVDGATISSRSTAGGDPGSAPSTGDSTAIEFDATMITVGDGRACSPRVRGASRRGT